MRWVLLVSLLLGGCGDDTVTLVVQVRTDLVPGSGFTSIRVTGDGFDERIDADPTLDWGNGVRVFETTALAVGERRLDVSAVDGTGSIVVGRPVSVELDPGVRIVTVLLSSRCAGVSCPGAGDPALMACLAGRCVAEGCSEETPALCTDRECSDADDCTMPSAPCAPIVCTPSGSCLAVPDRSTCSPAELCDPVSGCSGGATGCASGTMDGDETDVDCGGSCAPCADGLACNTPLDCAGGACAMGACRCRTGTALVNASSTPITAPPALVWTGTSAILAWSSGTGEVTAQPLTHTLDRIGDVAMLASAGAPDPGAVRGVATEDGAAFVWGGAGTAFWAEVRADGAIRDSGDLAPARNPDIAWSGTRLGIAFEVDSMSGGDVSFRFTDEISSLSHPSMNPSILPSVVWAGTQYFMAWNEIGGAGTPCLLRLGAAGAAMSAGGCFGETVPGAISTATDGTDLAAAWADGSSLIFRRISADESPLGRVDVGAPVAPGHPPDLVAYADGHALAWFDAGEIHFARIERDSVIDGPRVVGSTSITPMGAPSLVRHPGGYLAAFAADGGGGAGCCFIYVAQICDP